MISLHLVVAFTQTVFTVFEGRDSFVTLGVSKSGNLDLPANVTFMTEAGTAFEGRVTLYRFVLSITNSTLPFLILGRN